MNNKVYISGGLTGVPNPALVKATYERLGQFCEEFGLDPYIPHIHTDPIAHAHVSAQQVYETDKSHLCTAGLVIAYVGIPSLGVGQEIEIAREHGIPIVLLCERNRPLSRMTRGCPGVIAEILYDNIEEALCQLTSLLSNQKKKN